MCLASVPPDFRMVVYVAFGTTDGNLAAARASSECVDCCRWPMAVTDAILAFFRKTLDNEWQGFRVISHNDFQAFE